MADKEVKKEEVGEVQEEDKKERQEETQVPGAAPLHGKKKTKGKKLKPRRKKKSILGKKKSIAARCLFAHWLSISVS